MVRVFSRCGIPPAKRRDRVRAQLAATVAVWHLLWMLVMIITLAVLAGIFLTGGIVMLVELSIAPEAYQNWSGFHLTWRNNSPEKCNIATIWSESILSETAASELPL